MEKNGKLFLCIKTSVSLHGACVSDYSGGKGMSSMHTPILRLQAAHNMPLSGCYIKKEPGGKLKFFYDIWMSIYFILKNHLTWGNKCMTVCINHFHTLMDLWFWSPPPTLMLEVLHKAGIDLVPMGTYGMLNPTYGEMWKRNIKNDPFIIFRIFQDMSPGTSFVKPHIQWTPTKPGLWVLRGHIKG